MAQRLADIKPQIQELVEQYRHQVDFLSVRLEESENTQVVIRLDDRSAHADPNTETMSEGIAIGGQVRACHRGGWGFASFNRLTELKTHIEETIAAARILGTERTCLAEIEPVQVTRPLCLQGRNPRDVSIQEKKKLCDRYAQVLQDTSELITTVAVRYSDRLQHMVFITSEGTCVEQIWVDMDMRFAATARNGNTVQTGRETTGSRNGYEDLIDLDARVRSAAERAVKSLSLKSVKGGVYPVVIDPILTGLFVHEAFGHLSEADMVYEYPNLLEAMRLGQRFGPPTLNIYDGAALAGHRGSYEYDDEGVPATITPLIQEGILVGRLHSRETAGTLGEQPTGNSRCLSYQHPPLVRMTNTWIGPGQTPADALFDDIKEGVYALNWKAGMTNGEMFTFSAGEAWMIRNGKIAEPIRDVTLSGNAFKTLAGIEAIGNDLSWDESGGCGKGGQDGLPVGCGGPSLRIRDVVVGGE
jgi:TldD protein